MLPVLRSSARSLRLLLVLPGLALGAYLMAPARAAVDPCISLTTPGTAYSQNFDTLSNTAASTTNALSIAGWYLTESGSGARFNQQYAVDTGSGNSGDTYSYGATGSTDRALGGLRSGSLIPVFGSCYTNNTGAAITSLEVGYTGEEWRLGAASRTDQINFEYSVNATSLADGTWTGVAGLNFLTPVTATTGAKDGNNAANRTAISSTISSLNIANGATFWIRWIDTDATSSDDGLAVDDFSLKPPVVVAQNNLTVNDVTQIEGNGSTTTFAFTVSLSEPAGAGGVTFDITTADSSATSGSDYVARVLTAQTIAQGSSSYTFDVTVNGDTAKEPTETFTVDITNITGAAGLDVHGLGTIRADDAYLIHEVQGSGSASPMVGSSVLVEGVVVGSYQGASRLSGFFLQEEDIDADSDPATSEGILVFCTTCPVAVAEGQRVRVEGSVSEFFNMTEITASTAGSVTVTGSGNHLADLTASSISLPISGSVADFYEAREGMLVTFTDTLSVSEYFQMARYGEVELYQGGRPFQFTETSAPGTSGYAAHLAALDRRRVVLDDDNNVQNAYLGSPSGSQRIFYPQANGGFSRGVQGTDYFRGGDEVHNLTGVLHWSFAGQSGTDAWRIRPTSANPVVFTATNPRPATPPAVGGAIKAVSMNLLNYFTTINTTSSTDCGPSLSLDCRGADSVAELNRQRERASVVVCGLNADVYAFMELENTTASDTINDLLGAVNTRCGGDHPYVAASTGGTLGTDAIRVQIIYRSGVLTPVGSPLVDMDSVHNRPPTAQTFDVTDPANSAYLQRFTVVANHFKSKGCSGATGGDADALDGQSCYVSTRTQQATRLLTWVNSVVVPAAGDADVLLLGDFNSYAKETPVTTLTGGGYTDLESSLLGDSAYSYLFDGQLGHLDYAFASAGLMSQVAGVGAWHINADEAALFDYNDEIKDTPEATFDAKPNGSSLTPPRVVFEATTAVRASDHDPILVGLFPIPTAPAAPTGVSAAAGDGTVDVQFNAPTDDGGSPITEYTATCTPLATAVEVYSASGTSSPITVTVPNGTTVSCTVHATNAVDDSAESEASAPVTPSPAPVPCGPGTFSASGTDQPDACTLASAGRYVAGSGATSETLCALGTYQPLAGAESCDPARAGHYVDVEGAAADLECAAGSYQDLTGQTSCNLASPGSYVPGTGASSQTACAIGYTSLEGATSCTRVPVACVAGTFSANGTDEPNACTPASAGHYVSTSGATGEAACAAGSYQDLTGQASCKLASPGFYVPSSGAASQIACAPGTTSAEGATTCAPLMSLSVSSASVTEGNTGTRVMAFTVTRSGASTGAVTVNWTTAPVSASPGVVPATAGVDFRSALGVATLPAGPSGTTVTVNVVVNGDTSDEDDEMFSVVLSNPSAGTLATATGMGTIVDDDDAPTLSILGATVSEGSLVSGTTAATFKVILSSATSRTVTVHWATSAGTATSGVDFQSGSGDLTFLPGGALTQNVTVLVNHDTLGEANETFFVTLSAPASATLGASVGTGQINNDDGNARLRISGGLPGDATAITVVEGSSTSAIVYLTKATGVDVTVNWAVSMTGRATCADLLGGVCPSGTLTIPAGAIEVPLPAVQVITDGLSERLEQFSITLSDALPTGPTGVQIERWTLTVTIPANNN